MLLRGLLLVVVSLLFACADGSPGSGTLSVLHVEPDPVLGGRIVDAEGRDVRLRGANVNALVEYWSGNDLPTVFPFDDADAQRMASMGWNVARLLVSWSRVEPEPGVYDEAYLDEVEGQVDRLARHGLYALIDFHQDAWGATLAAGPDEVCLPGGAPALGWDGAPGWATLGAGERRCFFAGSRETSSAVAASFAAFFDDLEGPGGVGIRTRYVAAIAWVARRFAVRAEVAGYDVMNEPNAFNDAQFAALADLYREALAAIRVAEREEGGHPHIVFFEPSILWSGSGGGAPEPFTDDPNIVYAPHLYEGGFNGGAPSREEFERARDEALGYGGIPVLSGEWGADPRRAGPTGDGYFATHQAMQDDFGFHATIWTWREACGDPHKVADVRVGREPYPWGFFDVDCETNAVVGERVPLMRDLARGRVLRAPGRLVTMTWAAGRLDATGQGASEGSTLEAFLPGRSSEFSFATTGLRDLVARDLSGSGVSIEAVADGADWSLVAARGDAR